MVPSHRQNLHLAAVCRGQESCGPGGEASVLHSTALSPPLTPSSRMTVSVKKILSVFTTLVIFLFYISKENFLTLSRPFRETFLKMQIDCFELVKNADLLSAASCQASSAWSHPSVAVLCLSFTWCQGSDACSVPATAALQSR